MDTLATYFKQMIAQQMKEQFPGTTQKFLKKLGKDGHLLKAFGGKPTVTKMLSDSAGGAERMTRRMTDYAIDQEFTRWVKRDPNHSVTVRLKLATEDWNNVRRLQQGDLLAKIKRGGQEWQNVTNVNFIVAREALGLHVRSEEAESQIRASAIQLKVLLELSVLPEMIPEEYLLLIPNFTPKKQGILTDEELKIEISLENGIPIARAYWSRNFLFLTLESKADARKVDDAEVLTIKGEAEKAR